VVDVDAQTSVVTVGPPDALLRDFVGVRDLWFAHEPPGPDAVLSVQVRAHGATIAGRLVDDRVEFLVPAPRVASGQVVALYDGDALVGGGVAA
jgi:tRNA U34 2-thiouridine synthase MnmA/TrmU